MKNPNSDQIFVVVNGGHNPQTFETFSSTEILNVATGNLQKNEIRLGNLLSTNQIYDI